MVSIYHYQTVSNYVQFNSEIGVKVRNSITGVELGADPIYTIGKQAAACR